MANAENTCEQALTHHVRLVLDNDESLYLARRELVQTTIAEYAETEFSPTMATADRLKAFCEELCDSESENTPMLALEVLTTALAFVDWYTMAVDYIEEER